MASLRVQEKRCTSRLTSAPSMIAVDGSEPRTGAAGSLGVSWGFDPFATEADGADAAEKALMSSRAS